jgi:lipid-A-disaccharide synthase
MNILLACAEQSGEQLLERYLSHLVELFPTATFYCQASKKFQETFPSVHILFDSELCSVMGFIEPLKRLPSLLARRKAFKKWILEHKPSLFIAFDAPDFFLSLEKFARLHGSYCIHVVSPSVWAWRPGRIKTVAQSANELHVLYHFEKKLYETTPLTVEFIGHPLLNDIISVERTWPVKNILLAPGSRIQEIQQHLPIMLRLAQRLQLEGYVSKLLIAIAPGKDDLVQSYLKDIECPIECLALKDALSQADFALVCSGTASLEIVAQGCPAVIMYNVSSWKLFLLKLIVHTKFIGLPNILLQHSLIQEFIGPLETMYDTLWGSVARLCQQKPYEELARSIRDRMTQLLQDNRQVSLKTILSESVSRVLMKDAKQAVVI